MKFSMLTGIVAVTVAVVVSGCKYDKSAAGAGNTPTHEKVQLWEGGPCWATTNIGAENPEDYGLYFWWGDTVGHRPTGTTFGFNFYDDNSAIGTYLKKVSQLQSEGWIVSKDGTYVLAPSHDAAHVQWGGSWRMPTLQELCDLCYNKCDWTWTTKNGVNGYVVRGRGDYASRSIFLPAAGHGHERTSLSGAGSIGYYWSSVPYPDYIDIGRFLYFRSDTHSVDGSLYYYGFPVRPVQDAASQPAK